MPPIFFLSYAHADYQASPKAFDKLYTELCQIVGPRTQTAVDTVGFRDDYSIRVGADWQQKLIGALQSCRVFVPVYSLNYFASDVCGREWGLFNDRAQSYALAKQLAATPDTVVPALWLAESDLRGRIPQPVRGVQYAAQSYGEDYARYGLENLHRRLKRNQFQEAVAALADDIVRVANAYPGVPPLAPPPAAIEMAPSMWATPGGAAAKFGPRYVQFIFVAATKQDTQGGTLRERMDHYGNSPEEWRPFLPPLEKEAILLATQVVNDEALFFQSIDIDNQLQQRVAEANQRRNLIALVVDTWSLTLPKYSNVAQLANVAAQLNCVVVVPCNGGDTAVAQQRSLLEQTLQATFAERVKNKDELISIDAIRSPDEFRTRLAKALARAKAAVDNTELAAQRTVPPGGDLPTISAA